jgi:hypothetical protein
MNSAELKARFHLIQKPKRVAPQLDRLFESPMQNQLFPVPKENVLIFLVLPLVSDEEFTNVLGSLRPVAILELRRSPRFDLGQLNRKEVFRSFKESSSVYLDLAAGRTEDPSLDDDPVQLVKSFLKRSGDKIPGPVMLLLNKEGFEEPKAIDLITNEIASLFASASKNRWEALQIPQFA